MKDMSGSVLEATEAKKKAEDLAFQAKQAGEKSAARIKSLEDQLHEMETELKKQKDQVSSFKSGENSKITEGPPLEVPHLFCLLCMPHSVTSYEI